MGQFDVILEEVGPFGRYQITYWILCGLAIAPVGMQHFANIFLQATPPHWCSVPELVNLSIAEQINITTPSGEWTGGDKSCRINDVDYEACMKGKPVNSNGSSRDCTDWRYDYQTYGRTSVTKWNLVCANAKFTDIAQSIYMTGVVVGAFVISHVADAYGRKLSLCLSLSGVVVFGVTSALGPGLWSHLLLRMFAGACAAGAITTACTLATEMMGIKKRALPGLSEHAFFVLGNILLTCVAWLMRDYMWTTIVISIIPVAMLPYWCILPESARWLMAVGRTSDAKKELTRMARMNGTTVSADIDDLCSEYISLELDKKNEHIKQQKHTILDLLKTANIRKRTLIVLLNWFVINLAHYSISLLYSELIHDVYINNLVCGVMEIALVLFIWLVVDRLGRRGSIVVGFLTSGAAFIVSTLIIDDYPSAHKVAVTTGRLAIMGSNVVMYVYVLELFPTVVRNIALGSGSTIGHCAAIIAPFVNTSRRVWEPLPALLCGLFAVTSGLLSLLLPETVGHPLPDTIEEAEVMYTTQKRDESEPLMSNTTRELPSEVDAILDAASPYPYPRKDSK